MASLVVNIDNTDNVLNKVSVESLMQVLSNSARGCDIPLSNTELEVDFATTAPDNPVPRGDTIELYSNISAAPGEAASYSPQQNVFVGSLTFVGVDALVSDGTDSATYVAATLSEAVTFFLEDYPSADRTTLSVNGYSVDYVGTEVRLV